MGEFLDWIKSAPVEWKPLGEVCSYIRGITYKKYDVVDKDENSWKVLRANNIKLENNQLNFDDVKKISYNVNVRDDQKLYKGDILMCASSGSKEHVGKTTYIADDLDYTFGGFMSVIRTTSQDTLSKYIYYLLNSRLFSEYLDKSLNSSTINNIYASLINDFTIPIPPMEVQEEIVKILDKFSALTTELQSELQKELELRRKQYDYYLNQLYDFERLKSIGAEIYPMGEVGTFTRGGSLQKKDFTPSGVGCIHYGQIYTHYRTYTDKTISFVSEEFAQKARIAKYGDLVIATTSENDEDLCKAVAWLGDESIAVSNDACFYTHSMQSKYVAYYFQTVHFQRQKREYITGTKVRRVNANDLAKIEIPIPPLSEQERIVGILDKFERLTHSLTEGLPREIELRQKQYEYYRNLLLSFE